MDNFTKAYIEAALWSSNDDNGDPFDENYTVDDISLETKMKMTVDCINFQKDNKVNLDKAYKLYPENEWTNEEQAGHDFWLTRNGHGCGFWDRGIGEVGDTLTEECKKYGVFDIYVGDNGEIYS